MSPYDQYQRALARIYQAIPDDQGNIVRYECVGTGFLVAERYVLTCAHVVAAALGVDGTSYDIPSGTVYLDFPFVVGEEYPKVKASVAYWLPEEPLQNRVEDIAGLCLTTLYPQQPSPVRLGSINDFSTIGALQKHSLRIHGFPNAPGQESGAVPRSAPLVNGWIQIEDTKQTGLFVKGGFSGAPVWDEQLEAVIGMVLAKDLTEPGSKVAYMIQRKDLPAFENQSLYGLLDTLSGVSQRIETDIDSVYQQYQFSELRKITLWGMLRSLEEKMSSPGSPISPVLKFVAALSLEIESNGQSNADIIDRLRNWVHEQGEDLEALQAYVQAQRKKPENRETITDSASSASQSSEQLGSSYLVVVVQSDPYDPDCDELSVSAWIIPDSSQYNAQTAQGCRNLSPKKELKVKQPQTEDEECQFAQQMSKYLYGFLRQGGSGLQNLTIEIFLPLQLLNHPADTWHYLSYGIEETFGSRYPLVLRSSERLEPDYCMIRDTWQQKWRAFKSKKDCENCCDLFVPAPPDAPINQIMSVAETAIGLQLPDGAKSGRGSPMAAVLAKGIPVAIWLRRCFSSRPDHRNELTTVMGCCVSQLPEQVKSARNEAFGQMWPVCHTDNDPVGHHLALLWEDYERLPPSAL